MILTPSFSYPIPNLSLSSQLPTLLFTLLSLFLAHVLYKLSRQRLRPPHRPPRNRSRRRPSVSEIAIEISERQVGLFAKAVKLTKLVIWDSFVYPILAWFFNVLAILFALLFSCFQTIGASSTAGKKLQVFVATSLSTQGESKVEVCREGTNNSGGRATSSGGAVFSMLMVPAALTCAQTRKSLVLDLDETLVHTQFKLTDHCDLRLEVRVDEFPAVFYVSKRPYLDVFLRTVAQWYDIVIFTASLEKYGDPLITVLDVDRVVKRRIFRKDCMKRNGNFVKDLTIVNPNLANVLIVDNCPASYSIQPSNAVPIEAWYHDQNDEELLNLLPLLHAMAFLNDVRSLLDLRLTGGALAGRTRRSYSRSSVATSST